MKNIFLSASIPLPERHPKYYDTADIIAIRDSIIALVSISLDKYRIIWGGHPSITPLIYYVMERLIVNTLQREDYSLILTVEEKEEVSRKLKARVQKHVKLYQSLYFKSIFPEDNEKFENIVFTENVGDIHSSVQLMREKMFSENEYSAAVFIGGMDGIEVEFNMFKERHPNALLLPVASTGAATKIVYESFLADNLKNERLIKDYGYMSMFQKLLLDQI
jgi:hypothetical protein